MKRIGILTCSNATQEVGCCSMGCLQAAHEGTGQFAEQVQDGKNPMVMGIINCAGCPSISGFDKILNRVKNLAEMGAEAIHMSSCMLSPSVLSQKSTRRQLRRSIPI